MQQARTDGDSAAEPEWVREVLRFWFEELGQAQWFRRDDAVDARIRSRFGALHERIVSEPDATPGTPGQALATLLVLDQFSRNLYRDDARAFAADARARRVARDALARGFDQRVEARQRVFFYLPFEHSEDRDDQRLSVELAERSGDAYLLRYARDHQAVIERFGRFPHRNAVLGRESTPEELAYLRQAGGWAKGAAAPG